VPADEQEQELVFLDSVYEGNAHDKVRVDKMSPLERFSARV
jgi:hypothetical protein